MSCLSRRGWKGELCPSIFGEMGYALGVVLVQLTVLEKSVHLLVGSKHQRAHCNVWKNRDTPKVWKISCGAHVFSMFGS